MSFGTGFGGGYQGMGGGGFMTEESPTNMDSSQSEQKKKSKVQSLIPCSVAMLHKAQFNKVDDVFRFNDIELHQVSIVGVIKEVQESSTNMLYKVDDMTADSIIVRKWIETEENSSEAMKRSQCREDTYVRVYGHLKSFQDTRCLIAFSITPVKDPNEISYHMLEIVHAFLTLTKGASMPAASTQMAGGMRTPGGNMAGGMNTPMRGGMTDAFGGGQSSGLGGPHKQVLDAIIASTDDKGMSVDTLKQSLRNLNDLQLKKAIEFLSNEGHIYSTIDDDHYRSTSS